MMEVGDTQIPSLLLDTWPYFKTNSIFMSRKVASGYAFIVAVWAFSLFKTLNPKP